MVLLTSAADEDTQCSLFLYILSYYYSLAALLYLMVQNWW